MTQKPEYADGERVLCFHGPLLYEAKCLKSEIRDKTMKYFIHYSGWNKNWDEWVPESRVLKYNDSNRLIQRELTNTHSTKSKKSKASKSSSKKVSDKEKEKASAIPVPLVKVKKEPKEPKEPKAEKRPSVAPAEACSKAPEPKKAKLPVERQLQEEPQYPTEIRIKISEPLRCWLVDDVDLITRQKKLMRLPARVTVDHIIASYLKEKLSVKGLPPRMEVTIIQVANRIRDSFNVLLGTRLLYKFERPQYAEILKEHVGKQMCEIYGAIHLLRMITIMGGMLTSVVGARYDLTAVVGHLEGFTNHIGSNLHFFSLDDYIVAAPEYHRRALM